jgi:hypothetical protein
VKNVGDRNIVSDEAVIFPASIYHHMEWSDNIYSMSYVSLYLLWHNCRTNRLIIWSRIFFEKNDFSQLPSNLFLYNSF